MPLRFPLCLTCFALLLTTLNVAVVGAAEPPPLPTVEPAAVGMSAERLSRIDDVVQYGLQRNRMPGCVVLVGRQGKIVFHKAYGQRRIKPSAEPMTADTVFDLASLTKPIATATSVMQLIEQGRIDLNAPVSKYLPDFAANGKDVITIRQLLTHTGGLIPDNSIRDYDDGPEEAFRRINALKTYVEPGSKFVYTDVGFIVLAEIVRKLTGQSVHEYSQQHIFQPLGMRETGYLPGESLRARAATTEEREGRWMRGEVHDPRAYRLGGVAGHAGLFSTATDLARYAAAMVNGGQYQGARILKPETVELMTRRIDVGFRAFRALGWDSKSGYSSNRGALMSPRAFGHGGFTGTAIWMDPRDQLFVIFLSNRVHPDGKGSVNDLAGRIGTIAGAAVLADHSVRRPDDRDGKTLTGIDVLQRDNFAALDGAKVGLITNHTGRSRDGRSTVRLLHEAKNVQLVSIFSPEHGLEGRLDIPNIGDTTDTRTGLKVHSLYGKTRIPTKAMLADIDTLVFDIQDIGARFYTYISTMGNAMQAAAEQDIRFVVLDRPNPIGAHVVQGPVLDKGSESFVGFHTLPIRHGMTVGELATMIRAEKKLDVDLHVVQVENWRRDQLWDRTGLTWINPSPNMRSLTQAILYPGIGIVETTNVSVGRGTDTPFEWIGAPWIDEQQLAAKLNAAGLPGIRFIPVRFTPTSSKHANVECGGVNFHITDRDRFDPLRTGMELARSLRALYPNDWQTKSLNRLLSSKRTLEMILEEEPTDAIVAAWQQELHDFLARRRKFLRYE